MGEQMVSVDAQLMRDVIEFLEGTGARVRERCVLTGGSSFDQLLICRADSLADRLQRAIEVRIAESAHQNAG